MEEEQKQNERPRWKGHIEVAGWEKKDKNGKTYISLKIANYVNLFEN